MLRRRMALSVAVSALMVSFVAHAALTETQTTIDASAKKFVAIPIEGVLLPSQGYDNNDRVEAVVYGNLPNSCYQLAKTKVIKEPGSHIRIVQYATRKTDGICAQSADLPLDLQMMIPFHQEIQLGMLDDGDYQIEYNLQWAPRVRTLSVAKAVEPSIDSLHYAVVSSAVTNPVPREQDALDVRINGMFTSTCEELERVEVKKVEDVYVVFPVTRVIPNMICAQTLVPFSKKVELGTATQGEYLVHVRSKGGNSINQLMRVVQK